MHAGSDLIGGLGNLAEAIEGSLSISTLLFYRGMSGPLRLIDQGIVPIATVITTGSPSSVHAVSLSICLPINEVSAHSAIELECPIVEFKEDLRA